MAQILQESVAVSGASPGCLRIQHTQVHADGIDMGGELVFDANEAGWLADQVDNAADAWGFAEVDEVRGCDHFTIYVGGSDMQPFVHVHNQRDPSAPDGRVYTLQMTVETARLLVADLRSSV